MRAVARRFHARPPDNHRLPLPASPFSAQSLERFLADGFAPFAAEYRALSVLLGRRVHFLEGDVPRAGVVVDHAPDGALVVRLDGAAAGDAPARFLSGEVTRLELDGGAGETVGAPA